VALTTRATVKTLLGIATSDTTQDDALDLCVSAAIGSVKAYLRRGMSQTVSPSWPESDTNQSIYLSGSDSPFLIMPFVPVTNPASVSIYYDPRGYFGTGTNPFASSTLLTEGTDYVWRRDDGTSVSATGMVLRLSGRGSTATGSMFGEDFSWFPFSMFSGNLNPGSLASSGRRPAVWASGPGCYKLTGMNTGFTTIPDDLKHATALMAIWMFRSVKNGAPLSSESFQGYSFSVLTGGGGPPEFASIRQLLARYRCESANF